MNKRKPAPKGSPKGKSAINAKLKVLRVAAKHAYPVADIDDMLAQVERGSSKTRNS